ncbi:hypothetical protein OKW34_002753 [Paraburkholderia youngii]
MLSPHEYATLVMVRDAPAHIDRERRELKTLLEKFEGLFANPA